MTWDKLFMTMCDTVALKSKDESTKVGCVIVGPSHDVRSIGFNGLPRGCRDDVPERQLRPEKYRWFEHAERNAIYNAARVGVPLEGCTLYVQFTPCCDCMRAIIQSGIIDVYIRDEAPERMRDSMGLDASMRMAIEAGINIWRCK
jgi:dCMP deaminase